jgi:predicted transcriptional regulator of viral defense system
VPFIKQYVIYAEIQPTDNKDLELLFQYAERLGNGAVYKRLGFLLERLAPKEVDSINKCRTNLTAGNAKLDPQFSADKLITRWRLWVPNGSMVGLKGLYEPQCQ